jgi:hypothetical protein
VTPPPGYRTDYRLWLVVGGGLFVALGLFDPSGGRGKGDGSLWSIVAVFVSGEYHCPMFDMLAPIALFSAMLAAPAALVGWAVQAVVVVIRSRRTASD